MKNGVGTTGEIFRGGFRERGRCGGERNSGSRWCDPIAPTSSMFVGTNVASNTPESAFSPPVNDLRTPPPVATTAPPVMVDLFAGLNVTPTPCRYAAAPPLPPPPPPKKKKKKWQRRNLLLIFSSSSSSSPSAPDLLLL